MDYSLPGSSVHGISQVRILELVNSCFSGGSSWTRDWTQVSWIAGKVFTIWATRKAHEKPRQHIKKQRHHFASKGLYSQSYDFSSSHVWMWQLDHKKGWQLKNWCFQIVVLEKTLESPWGCKEIKSVNLKGNQPWIFAGRIGAEVPGLWPPVAKIQLIGKDHDSGKDQGQEKQAAANEIVRWHHWFSGHEFEQTLGNSEGQGSLACCSSQGSQSIRHNLVTEQQSERLRIWNHDIAVTFFE